MLINSKAIKQYLKDKGFRSNKSTIGAIDKKVDMFLTELVNKCGNLKKITEVEVLG